jgi:hypothetical protein
MGSASDIPLGMSLLICLITDFFVHHLLLLYRVLLDTSRIPLIAVVQGVIGWSVRHTLLLYRVSAGEGCGRHYQY